MENIEIQFEEENNKQTSNSNVSVINKLTMQYEVAVVYLIR